MATMKVQGYEKSIQKIFSNEFIFNIPEYQRPYAWTTKEAGDLLDDLLDSIGYGIETNIDLRMKEIDDLNQYFLGSIVIIKKDEDKPDAEVIDGQQRLLTLTILLSVLRDLFHNFEKTYMEKMKFLEVQKNDPSISRQLSELENKFGESRKFADSLSNLISDPESVLLERPARYRLTLNDGENNATLKGYVQADGMIEKLRDLYRDLSFTEINIRDNARYFQERIMKMKDVELVSKRLAKFIAKNCILIVVSTTDFDSAYRIFTILNDRGLDLSHADKLKAEIIGKIPKIQRKDEAKKWQDKEDELGREPFSELFYHIRMIACKTKPRRGLLEDFREFVIEPLNDPREAIDLILGYADIFDDIKNSSYNNKDIAESDIDEINTKLSWLDKIDNKDWIPPAMLFFDKFNHEPPEILIKFFLGLERLAAGLMIRRADVNERIKRYGDVLIIIENAKDIRDLFNEISPLEFSSAEVAEIIQKLEGDLYLETKFRLYVLYRLNDAYSDESVRFKGKFEFPKPITIEHVLPQTLPKASEWERLFYPPLHDKYIHKLGNLALLTRRKGSQAGDHEFDQKKEDYVKEKFGITTNALINQVMKEESWTPEVIDKLQAHRIGKLKQIWRL